MLREKYWRVSLDLESYYVKVKCFVGMIINLNLNVNSVIEINNVKVGGNWFGSRILKINM